MPNSCDCDQIMLQYTCKHLCAKSHPINYSSHLGRNLNEPFSSYINYRTMRGNLASKLYTTFLYSEHKAIVMLSMWQQVTEFAP